MAQIISVTFRSWIQQPIDSASSERTPRTPDLSLSQVVSCPAVHAACNFCFIAGDRRLGIGWTVQLRNTLGEEGGPHRAVSRPPSVQHGSLTLPSSPACRPSSACRPPRRSRQQVRPPEPDPWRRAASVLVAHWQSPMADSGFGAGCSSGGGGCTGSSKTIGRATGKTKGRTWSYIVSLQHDEREGLALHRQPADPAARRKGGPGPTSSACAA